MMKNCREKLERERNKKEREEDYFISEAEAMIAAPPAGVLNPAPVVDSASHPFEGPSSHVDTAFSDSDAEPLGSPTTSEYFAGSGTKSDPEEFSEEEPSGDDSFYATSGTDETPSA
ncbi:hypothetical protein Tco_1301712 [Tanacetum coccineum]